MFITDQTEAEVDELACCCKSRGCWRPRAVQSILFLTIFSSCFKIIIDNRKATYPAVPSQGSCQTKAIANSFLEGSTLWDGAHVDQTEQEEQRKTYSLVRLEKLVKAITNLVWMKKGIFSSQHGKLVSSWRFIDQHNKSKCLLVTKFHNWRTWALFPKASNVANIVRRNS